MELKYFGLRLLHLLITMHQQVYLLQILCYSYGTPSESYYVRENDNPNVTPTFVIHRAMAAQV